MKQFFLASFLAILTLNQLYSQSYEYVTSNALNLRSRPELSESNILLILELNDKVEILESGESWTKVKYNSSIGYVSSKYLSYSLTEQSKGTDVLICNSGTAYAYHSGYCSGLNKCTHSISTVKSSEAKDLGRTPCKICYSGSSTTPTGSYKSSTIAPKESTSSSGRCSSVQCSGTTQKGLRCKNRTTNCNGRCYHH